MTSALQIEKGLSTEVRAVMADRQDLCGRFFLADQAENHYGQENLLDVLNQADHRFIPFVLDDKETVVLIQKSRIVGLQPFDLNDQNWPNLRNDDEQSWPPAQVIMSGHTIDGWAFTGDLEPQKRRLTDLLNHHHSFFVFDSASGPWIINKDRLNFLVPQG